MGKKLNNNTFIENAVKIHGDLYDYSLVDYKNNKTKVRIVCKTHGEFLQIPLNHLNGKSGCHKCYGNVKPTVEEFIKQSILIHGVKYDYSLVNYINDKTKIKIICHKHGEFLQTPNVHLKGHGCFICGNKNDLETFVEKSKKIYGNLNNYSLVEYKNINTPVNIICKIHGTFSVIPHNFLHRKNGCYYCNSNIYKDISFFIEEANIIHNYKYLYKEINNLYKDSYILITCPSHGDFKQKIRSHIYDKTGCPYCSESKGEREINNYLIENKINFIRQKKFDGCINKFKLPFDFYLPDLNLCIEYDGEQHFEINDYFGGKEGFEKVKINDGIKNSYCENNGINLIRIPYYDYNNILKLLNEKLLLMK